MRYQLGFIGAGNMAEAMARAAVDAGVVGPSAILAADPAPARAEVFAGFGVACVTDGAQVVANAEQIVLAVKPQTLPALQPMLARVDRAQQVVISIMAGVTVAKLEATLGGPARVIRVMPNTPLLAGKGMSAVAPGPHARDGDADLTLKVLRAAGEAVVVDESMMDAVTAVSGSGPAYLFYLAEAMQQAARELGLGEHAALFANQTLLGAAALLTQSPDDAATLRAKVTSPHGTTHAAITHLEDHAVRQHVVEAIAAAARRSAELGR
jgi:pyrroline-5-carboxylate reductase